MNYEAMWNELKSKIESDLRYHQSGFMQSIGESIGGETKCKEILGYMATIEANHMKTTTINRWSDCAECPENVPVYVGNPSDEIWTTRDGTMIKVSDMTDDHVRNCYHFVKDAPDKYWLSVFKAELDKRNIDLCKR